MCRFASIDDVKLLFQVSVLALAIYSKQENLHVPLSRQVKKLQNHFINELSVKTCGNVSRHVRFHLRTRQRDTKTDDLVLTSRREK